VEELFDKITENIKKIKDEKLGFLLENLRVVEKKYEIPKKTI
jgi:hypothetical protein